jgi:hypothetical protein
MHSNDRGLFLTAAAAAQADGGAAARHDAEKTSQYQGYGTDCYNFFP